MNIKIEAIKKQPLKNKFRHLVILLPLIVLLFVPSVFAQTADVTGPAAFGDCDSQQMTVTINNNGTQSATDVLVEYIHIAGFSYVTGSTTITYSTGPVYNTNPTEELINDKFYWNLPDEIPAGANVVITFNIQTNCSATSGVHRVFVYYGPVPQASTSDSMFISVNHGAITVNKTPSVNPAEMHVGDTITWTITIKSTGYGPARNLEITDTLGAGFTLISSDIGPGNSLTGTYAQLDAGDSLIYTVQAQVSSCSDLEDTISVSWGCGGGTYCQTAIESSASIDLTIRDPQLHVDSISPNPINFSFCSERTVSVQISNIGTGTAYNSYLAANIPAGYNVGTTTLISATPPATVTWNAAQSRWDFGNIPASGHVEYTFTLTRDDYCTANDSVLLFDANAENECAEVFTAPMVEIRASDVSSDIPTLSASKTAPVEATVGDSIPFTLTVSYNGNPAYSGDVTIVDHVPSPLVPQNITPAGTWEPVAGTITWVIPQALVIDGVILDATYDCPMDDPDICLYCFHTFSNSADASTILTCPLAPGGTCPINATASAATRINCEEIDIGDNTVTGSKDMTAPPPPEGYENCTSLSFTFTFVFGTGVTGTWSDIALQEMLNNNQIPAGSDAIFTVSGPPPVTVTQSVPINGRWDSLSFLDGVAPGPAGQTLTVEFEAYQNDTGTFYNDAVLTVPGLGGNLCSTGNEEILVTEQVSVAASSGSIGITMPAIQSQCETLDVVLTVSKGTFPLYNPAVTFSSDDYQYIPNSAQWNGDGTNFPAGFIEPEIVGNTLRWDNDQFGFAMKGAGVDQYYSFENGGTITLQVIKVSSCSNFPTSNAELYFDDNCERLGRNGAPSPALKSTDSAQPVIFTKGNIIIRKFPELVTSRDDLAYFTVTVVNSGDGPTYNTVFRDILGPDLIYDPVYPGPATPAPDTVDPTNRILTFLIGDLAPNEERTFTIPVRLVGCDEPELINTAEAEWGCGGILTDCQPLPVSRQARVRIPPSLLLIRGSGDINLCETNNLRLEVLNAGDTVLYNAQAIFILPTGVIYLPGNAYVNGTAQEPTISGNELIWDVGTMNVGDPSTIITFDVTADCSLPEPVIFQAYGIYIEPCKRDAGITTNSETYELDIHDHRPDIVVVKTPPTSTADRNQPVTWTITMTNTGDSIAHELEFYDVLPPNVSIPAGPGWGIINELLDGGAPPGGTVFDDGGDPHNLGDLITPRTLIDLSPGSTISFQIVTRVNANGCTPLPEQNTANVTWGCGAPFGCEVPYVTDVAQLITSPFIEILNHTGSEISICGAEISFQIRNNGSTAYNINLTDTLPNGYVYIPGTATMITNSGTAHSSPLDPEPTGTTVLTWDSSNISEIWPNETLTITLRVQNNISAPPPPPLPPNCFVPIDDDNTVGITYENSCSDPFGPVTDTLHITANTPVFTVVIIPATQIILGGSVVNWTIQVNNGAGGNIIGSLDVAFQFGPGFDWTTINALNGSDGTVPVVDNVNGRVVYYDVSIPENSAWTAPISAQALPNPPIVDLVVDVTATGICGSGCFYGEVTFTSSAAHGDMSKTADITEAPIGEIVTYTITVDYNHSSTLYQNAYIEDTLPAGLTLVSQTYTGPNQPITAVETSPNVWQWNVGDFTSAAGGSQSVITIGARVDNILANQDGLLFTDRADVRYLVGVFDFQDFRTLDAPTIIEPDLQVAKALARVTPAPPPADQGDAGDVVEYRLTVSHTGTSTADAYNVTIEDPIPADMTYVAGSQSSSPAADNFQIAGNTLQWTYNTFTQGTTATITYRLSVDTTAEPEQVVTNTGTLKWTSLPSGHTNDGTVHERDGDDGPGLLNDYVDTASSSYTITSPSFTKVLNAAPPLPEYTITSAIPYRITVNVIEGTIPDLVIRENIPDYMTISNISITSAWPYSTTGPVYAPGTSYIEWDFGTISNPAPSSGNIIIDFDLIVSDDANNDDLDTFTNSSRMTYQNASGSTVTLTSTAVPVQINVPALVTTKTVTSVNGGPATATVAPGDVITYRYRVRNVGSGTASNVNITDTFPDNYLSYLSLSATVNGVLLGSDPTGLPGPNLDFNLNLTIAGYGQADLIFQATVLPDVSDVTAGTVITNTAHAAGNDAEGNPIPADNRDHVAVDNDLDDTDSVNRTVVVPGLIVDKAIIQINGIAPVVGQKIEPGDEIRYRITVRNVGGANVYNLTVTDWLPTPGFTYQAGSTNATWQYPAPLSPAYTGEPAIIVNQLQWIIPGTQLNGGNPMGNWLQLEFTCDISSDITEGDTYTNETYVIAYDGHSVQVPAASSDPEDTNPTDRATVSIIGAEPIITSTKTVYRINGAVPTDVPPIAGLNDIVTFQYEVQNTGSGTAYNIILQDALPAGFSYVNNSTSITWPGGSLTNVNPTAMGPPLEWNMNTLQPAPAPTLVGGGTLTLRFDAQVTNNAYVPLPAGNWINNASVRVEDGAGTELTHNDDAEVAPAQPALVVNKEVVSINGVPGALDAEPGDYVLYRITVTNVGRGLASNFNVEDSVPAGLDYSTTVAPPCATNASWTGDFTGTFTNDPSVAGNPTTGETLTWNTTSILGGDGVILGFNNVLTVEYTIYVTSSITEGQTLTNQCYSNALDGRDVQIPADNSAAVPADTDNDDRDDASIKVHEPAFVTDKTIVAVNGVPPTSTPPVVGYNDTVTFEYSVQNVGVGTAHNIVLSDTLPAGFSYAANSTTISWPGGTLSNVNPTVMGPPLAWSMDTLQPAPLPTLGGGETLTLRFTAQVTDTAFRPLPAGNWINTSWVRGNDGAGTAIPLNNSADVPADIDLDDEDSVDMIPAEPALVVDKEVVSVNGVAGITAVQPGDYIRYRSTITNVGQGLAFRMILDDTLDIGLDYDAATCSTNVSWDGDFTGSFTNHPAVTGDPTTGENIRWNSVSILGGDGIILTPGAEITIEYDIYVTTFIVQGQPIDNVMHAAGVDGRTTSIPEDNSSNVPADTDNDDRDNTMLFTHEPALIVTKTVDKEVRGGSTG